MKHVKQLEKDISQFILRAIKETKYNCKYSDVVLTDYIYDYTFRHINSIIFDNDIYEDIINEICIVASITKSQLIEDINEYIKKRNLIKEKVNEHNLIEYFKTMPNSSLLKKPLDRLFSWEYTKRGFDFYNNAHQKMSQRLKYFYNLYEHIYKCVIDSH